MEEPKGMSDVSNDSWFAWSRHVLMQLEQDTKCLYEIKKEQTNIKIEIAKLKVKAGIWGATGGIASIAIILGIWFIRNRL